MDKKKDLFESLQERNKETNTPSTKLNENKLNDLVDTISPPLKPKKFQVNPDIPFLQQLAEEHKKDGGDS